MTERIDPQEAKALITLVRQTIQSRLTGAAGKELSVPENSPLKEPGATFVTLKKQGQLRGCIGNLEPVGSIWDSARQNAVSAAFHDTRFTPLREQELAEVEISVSILSEPVILEYRDAEDLAMALRPGIDGVILRSRGRSATFLPQVWEQLPAVELFLGHLCRKAGLSENCWLTDNPEILTYQVQNCSEEKS